MDEHGQVYVDRADLIPEEDRKRLEEAEHADLMRQFEAAKAKLTAAETAWPPEGPPEGCGGG